MYKFKKVLFNKYKFEIIIYILFVFKLKYQD